MVETSAHLVDHVIPKAPVRQWVLSFPWPLRLLFARQTNTLSRCLAVIIRAIETDLIQPKLNFIALKHRIKQNCEPCSIV